MDNKLWQDIQAQGTDLARVVAHLYSQERASLQAAAQFLHNDRPIALLGVASAAYLCHAAAHYLGAFGRFASVLPASDGLYGLLPMLASANVVVNSRSGETAEIVRLAEALADKRIPFLAITNEPESQLARLASVVVWANTRKDDLVSINVVSGMLAATLAVAAAALGRLDRERPEFERLAAAMGGVVERANEQAASQAALFAGVRPIYLLYRGPSQSAALCGRLVLEEVARTPAVALEAAEFRQGPNEVVDERFGAVVFVPAGPQGELNRALVGDLKASRGRVLAVGDAGDGQLADLDFPLPSLPGPWRAALEIVPVQLLAYRLAEAQGYTPGDVRYITKVILQEKGIPNRG